jgi:hypothetical protein
MDMDMNMQHGHGHEHAAWTWTDMDTWTMENRHRIKWTLSSAYLIKIFSMITVVSSDYT